MARHLILAFLMTLLFQGSQAKILLGHEGNGGESVEAFFLKRGNEILDILSSSDAGNNFLLKYSLNYNALRATLNAAQIETTTETLKDVNGHIVEAIGEKGKIILHQGSWEKKFNQPGDDVDELIFHEMLRSAGVNDNDYRVSQFLIPVSQYYSDQDQSRISNYIRPERILIEISGKKLAGDVSFIRVQDMSRTVEINLPDGPEAFVRSGQERNYSIVIRPSHVYSKQLKIREVSYEFNGRLSIGTSVRFERSITTDDQAVKDQFFADKNPLNNLSENGIVFSDQPNVVLGEQSETLQWDANLGFHNNSATNRVVLTKIVLTFDL